jgi:dATP pyrophosphohydrolase
MQQPWIAVVVTYILTVVRRPDKLESAARLACRASTRHNPAVSSTQGSRVKSQSAQIPVRSRAVAAVILAGRGEAARVLVLQRNKNTSRGLWSLVMGRLEKGESAVEAIRREIAEETGIAAPALYTTGCVDAFFNSGANSIEMMPIFVALFDSAPEVTLDHEHLAYRWLSFAEAVEALAYPGQRDALPHIKRDFADREPPPFRLIRDE